MLNAVLTLPLALLLTGWTLDIMSLIGIIMLMAPVTRNAILLVDDPDERRTAGDDRWGDRDDRAH